MLAERRRSSGPAGNHGLDQGKLLGCRSLQSSKGSAAIAKQKITTFFWYDNSAEEAANFRCGWLKDKYGLSWQIVPTQFGALLGDRDPAKAKRVMEAMLQMSKLDIATLQKAYEGGI